jgi:hypothetical protein
MRALSTRFHRLACSLLVVTATAAGCDDDDDDEGEDVVLPDSDRDFVVFNDLDDDGDGLVSTIEWAANFGEWDLNRDGEIEVEEWADLGQGLGVYDTDGDGTLNPSEHAASFSALDTNGDGSLDSDELGF